MQIILKLEFTKFIPRDIEEGKLYISMHYATAVHKCCCGCGSKVAMAISPARWQLIFDGETVSFNPSIGNHNFKCKSHYWIRRNKVIWTKPWSKKQIEQGRKNDLFLINKWHNQKKEEKPSGKKFPKGFWGNLRSFLPFKK